MSGLTERNVRDKLLDGGWMRNRQAAKELDELQRVAEQAKRNDETSKAMSRNSGHVAVIEERKWDDNLPETLAAFSSGRSEPRSNVNSPDSGRTSRGSSNGSNSLRGRTSEASSENFECYYCKTKSHRGGWSHCPKRKKENPDWNPKRRDGNKGKKDFQ